MLEAINHDRRRLLGNAVLTIAAAELDMVGLALVPPMVLP